MITEKDLQEAIAECEGQRNPTANTCIKLAAFYTIRQHMFPNEMTQQVNYSFAAPEVHTATDTVNYEGKSDFIKAVQNLPQEEAWSIVDELMSTLEILNPKLYKSIMRKVAE